MMMMKALYIFSQPAVSDLKNIFVHAVNSHEANDVSEKVKNAL
jgi:plasmid stabilization system protein ParE